MNDESGKTLWDQTVAATRRRTEPVPAPDTAVRPPPDFASRLAARWAELRQNEIFRLWCRWSLRAAVAGALIAVIVALLPPPRAPVPPLRAPGVEVPFLPPP